MAKDYRVDKVEIGTWQGFLQQIVDYVNKGYWYHCLTNYPEKKREKWRDIDRKLVYKYNGNYDKWTNYFRKRNGIANFAILRWQNKCVMLHTLGEIDVEDKENMDVFFDIRQKPLILPISDSITFKILLTHKTEVYFDRDCYRNLKAKYAEYAMKRMKNVLIESFNKLNSIPSYKGIVEQKRSLLRFIIKEARRYQMKISWKDFKFNTFRKVYKVLDSGTSVNVSE